MTMALAMAIALGSGLGLGAAGGCAEPDSVVIRVSVQDFTEASELTHLEITVAASGTEEGDRVCTPYSETFPLDPGEAGYRELPLTILVRPGERYDRILYVRVRGYLNGMLRLQMARMISLEGGELTLELELLQDCLGVATGAGQHCVNGAEVSSPYAPIFDDSSLWEDQPCVEP